MSAPYEALAIARQTQTALFVLERLHDMHVGNMNHANAAGALGIAKDDAWSARRITKAIKQVKRSFPSEV